jgi:glycosyltransferase involved in cell wall biosynthesis
MLPQPLVSIIIIFLNAADFLQEAIESVLTQTYENWELLLVDDGSSDGSTAIASGYVTQYPEKLRSLEHPNHDNFGMSASRNLGIRHAKGQYIAFLDADDVWMSDKLAHQIQIMTSHPEVAMIYGNTLYWHSWTGRPEDKQYDHIPFLGVKPDLVIEPPRLLQLYLSGQSAVPCTCSILVRSQAVKRVGGFEESFRGMYEDQAFYAKISLSEPIFVSEACLDRYRQHANSISTVTETTGQASATRLKFLDWLTQYLTQQKVDDTALWMVLRQELWLVRRPFGLPVAGTVNSLLRWMKKWVLRMEKRLLPVSVRLWLWTRDLNQ